MWVLPLSFLLGCSGSSKLNGTEWIWVGKCIIPCSTLRYTEGGLVKGRHLRWAKCLRGILCTQVMQEMHLVITAEAVKGASAD